jgi:hypothetical protein
MSSCDCVGRAVPTRFLLSLEPCTTRIIWEARADACVLVPGECVLDMCVIATRKILWILYLVNSSR